MMLTTDFEPKKTLIFVISKLLNLSIGQLLQRKVMNGCERNTVYEVIDLATSFGSIKYGLTIPQSWPGQQF